MASYSNFRNLESLADAYGYDMMLHGKSMYWSSPRSCPDTTADLMRSAYYQSLPQKDQSELLSYGNLMKRFGMGCYQERGANADLYNRYGGKNPPNPFVGRVSTQESESAGRQPGEE